MSIADKWQWTLEQSVKYREQIEVSDVMEREREDDPVKQKLPFYLMGEGKLKTVAEHLGSIFSKLQTDFSQSVPIVASILVMQSVTSCLLRSIAVLVRCVKRLGFHLTIKQLFHSVMAMRILSRI